MRSRVHISSIYFFLPVLFSCKLHRALILRVLQLPHSPAKQTPALSEPSRGHNSSYYARNDDCGPSNVFFLLRNLQALAQLESHCGTHLGGRLAGLFRLEKGRILWAVGQQRHGGFLLFSVFAVVYVCMWLREQK